MALLFPMDDVFMEILMTDVTNLPSGAIEPQSDVESLVNLPVCIVSFRMCIKRAPIKLFREYAHQSNFSAAEINEYYYCQLSKAATASSSVLFTYLFLATSTAVPEVHSFSCFVLQFAMGAHGACLLQPSPG